MPELEQPRSVMSLEQLLEHHMAIVGITGGGKGHLAKHLHKTTLRVSVFFNPQDEPGVVGVRTEKWDRRILATSPKVNLVVSDEDYAATFEAVRRDLFELGARIQAGRGRVNKWAVMWADEAQELAPEGTRATTLHRAVKRGRRFGITVVVITQAAADLSKGVLKQCRTHVIFPLGRYEAEYAKTYNLPVEPGQLHGHQFIIATEAGARGPFKL